MNELALMLLGGLIGKAVGEKGLPSDAEIIELLRSLKPTMSKTITLDISQVRDNEVHNDAGYAIFMQNPENASVPVYVRLNEEDSELIDITETRKIIVPFYRFFITNAAGTGTLTLIVSKSPAFGILEASTNVNIIAQTIGNLLMTFNAQTVGVYLQPEWAGLQGIDKAFYIYGLNKPYGGNAVAGYTVPSGKTLYITGVSFNVWASSVNDADAPQIGCATVQATGVSIRIAGNGGGGLILTPPLVIAGGTNFGYDVYCFTHHNCTISMCAWGYEI